MTTAQCSQMVDDCRAAKKEQGALICTALNNTNFGCKPCPFYKPVWRYEYELSLIAKGTKGYTPIVLNKEATL